MDPAGDLQVEETQIFSNKRMNIRLSQTNYLFNTNNNSAMQHKAEYQGQGDHGPGLQLVPTLEDAANHPLQAIQQRSNFLRPSKLEEIVHANVENGIILKIKDKSNYESILASDVASTSSGGEFRRDSSYNIEIEEVLDEPPLLEGVLSTVVESPSYSTSVISRVSFEPNPRLMDENEDNSFDEEDLPKEYKKDKFSVSIFLEWKLNQKNISVRSMKRLMKIICHGTFFTLDEQIQDSAFKDESTRQARNEYEAKIAARKIFQNVVKPGSRFISLEDIKRFLQEDEALKTMNLFEGAYESKTISKNAPKNFVVHAFRERRALALTLKGTKTAVKKLHQMLNILVGIVVLIFWLLILGIATSEVFVFIASQLFLAAFIYGDTCKSVFEGTIFLFVTHPFDVGDRCEIDGVQMIVEEINILSTVFLRYDGQRITIPNSFLASRPINNYHRSPDMLETIEFSIHLKTPAEKIGLVKRRILSYIEHRRDH